MAESEQGRIYGAADPEQQEPPPEQGLRGEQGAPIGAGPPGLTQQVVLGDNHVVELQQSSGTAFAEVTGALDRSRAEPAAAPEASPAPPSGPEESSETIASAVAQSASSAARTLRGAAHNRGTRDAMLAGLAGAVGGSILWLLRARRRGSTVGASGLGHRSDGSEDSGSLAAAIADEGTIPNVVAGSAERAR